MAFFYISLVFYFASSVSYLLYLPLNKRRFTAAGQYLLVLAASCHLLALIFRYVQAGYTPITNFYESLSFFAFSVAVAFLYFRRIERIDIIGCIVIPVVTAILLAASTLSPEVRPLPPVLRSYWLPLHTIFSFFGNAMFFIGFLISLIYIATERKIKKKRLDNLGMRLPSLEALDSISYRCMSYGFPFLTVGIITGSLWAGNAWGAYWSWDPKETFSLITWIVYAILVHNRLAIGWRGRKTAYMMIVGFCFVVITFLGVNFLIGGRHSYL